MRKHIAPRRGTNRQATSRSSLLQAATLKPVGGRQLARATPLAAAIRTCTTSRAVPRRNVLAVSAAAVGLQLTTMGVANLAYAATDEIIVTATRREQTVQEIPFNISAVSGDALEKANIIDAVEALRTVPGISIQDRGYRNSGVTNGVVIRGINVDAGTQGDVPLAAPPTVATYIDNTALYGNFILKDIERVEVLRGPQGTLYGSGSLAGNVRYIMAKPSTEGFSGKTSVSVGITDGSDGYSLNPDILLNMPLSETIALRVNAGFIDNEGIVDYPNLYALDANGDPVVTGGDIVNAEPVYTKVKDADDASIKYARASALYTPNDSLNIQLSYQWQDDEIGGRRQVTRGDNLATGGTYGEYEFGAVQLEPSDREVQMTALEVEAGLGFATLTSSTSYYEHTGTGINDNSGVYARNGWFSYYGSSPRPIAQAERFYDDSAVSQEFRLVSDGENFIDWTVGVYYLDQDYDLGQNSYLLGYVPYLDAIDLYGLAPFSTNQDFLFRRDQDYEELAGFGEVTINIRDDLHFTLGGRYFDNEVDVDAIVDVPIYSSPANPPGVASEKISDDDFLFKANIAWDVTDTSMVYGTYSQGYRHAGANAVPTTGKYRENPDYFTFDADTVDNFEIGYKGNTEMLNYAASLYYADWDKPQLNTATSNWGFFAVINGDSARTQGFELEVTADLTESLSVSLGYTYADAELTADVFQPAGNIDVPYTDRVAADGDRLPGTAEHVVNLAIGHELMLGNGMALSTVLSGYYQSDVINAIGDNNCLTSVAPSGACRDSANPASLNYAPTSIFSRAYAEIDSFQLWNLSSTLSRDSWGASLYVKNLFNDEGTTGEFPFLLGGSNTDPLQNYFGNNSRDYIALPRTIGVALTYEF